MNLRAPPFSADIWRDAMVGERGFEPPAPASRRQCSTRLSYSPTERLRPLLPWGGGPACQARGLLAEAAAARKRLNAGWRAFVTLAIRRGVNPLEALATLAGLANIVLLVRRNVWNYPFGLLMVAIYAWIFSQARLYSDALLQGFFFVVQVYGWWAWARVGGTDHPVAVTRLTGPARIAWALGILLLSALWGLGMARGTNAAFPWWDAAIAVSSVAAQILLARRCIENWWLWIGVDVAAIGLYSAKGLLLTAGLYGIFLVLSGVGLVQWRRAGVKAA